MLHLLLMVIPVFLVLFLGKGLQIAGLIDAGFIRSANHLVCAVFLPVLLFNKISGADLGLILLASGCKLLLMPVLWPWPCYGFFTCLPAPWRMSW